MSYNSFGHLFRVTTWGESHGPALGCTVDGCPPGIALAEADLQRWLDRRRPGQNRYTTQRREPDAVEILSGVYEGSSTGAPDPADDPQRRPALEGLRRDRAQVPPGSCRLHLLGEIRAARSARRWTRLGARDRGAGRRRRCCARGAGRSRPRAQDYRRHGADGPPSDRPKRLGPRRDRAQPVLVPGPAGAASGRRSSTAAQGRRIDRRGDRGGGRGRPPRASARRSMPSSTPSLPRR